MTSELPARLYRFSKTDIALEVLTKNEAGEFVWSRHVEPYVFTEELELAAAHSAHGGSIVPLEKPKAPAPEPHIFHRHSQPPPTAPNGPKDWLTKWQLDHDQ